MSDKQWRREGAAIIDEAGEVAALATTNEAQARILKAANCHEDAVTLARLVERSTDCEHPDDPDCACLRCHAVELLRKAE